MRPPAIVTQQRLVRGGTVLSRGKADWRLLDFVDTTRAKCDFALADNGETDDVPQLARTVQQDCNLPVSDLLHLACSGDVVKVRR